MAELFSFYNRPKRKSESFTNRKQAVYNVIYDKDGVRKLVKDKDIDIYEKIQEYANDCNLSQMFGRYGLNSMEQLKKSEEQLIDLTNLPSNLMESMNIINNAQYAFDRQSKEIKQKFNNNFKEFLAASENGQLAKLLNDELKVSAERFNTANMANFDSSKVNLVNHTQQVNTTPNIASQGNIQPQMTQQTQNLQQGGVNLNV